MFGLITGRIDLVGDGGVRDTYRLRRVSDTLLRACHVDHV